MSESRDLQIDQYFREHHGISGPQARKLHSIVSSETWKILGEIARYVKGVVIVEPAVKAKLPDYASYCEMFGRASGIDQFIEYVEDIAMTYSQLLKEEQK